MNSDTAPREGDDRARALNAGRKMRNSIRGIDDARCERDERSKNFSVYPRCFNPGAQARLHIGKKTRRPAKIEIRVLGNTYLFKERQRQMTFDVIVDAGCIIPGAYDRARGGRACASPTAGTGGRSSRVRS